MLLVSHTWPKILALQAVAFVAFFVDVSCPSVRLADRQGALLVCSIKTLTLAIKGMCGRIFAMNTRRRPESKLPKIEFKHESRAVLSAIEEGSSGECPHCEEKIKYAAKQRANRVICNVYVDGKWDRVEHYHEPCYQEAGQPYGGVAGGVEADGEQIQQQRIDEWRVELEPTGYAGSLAVSGFAEAAIAEEASS